MIIVCFYSDCFWLHFLERSPNNFQTVLQFLAKNSDPCEIFSHSMYPIAFFNSLICNAIDPTSLIWYCAHENGQCNEGVCDGTCINLNRFELTQAN
jgi:hypothetical protein